MASYWGLVVKRAWADSTPWFGRDPRKNLGKLIAGVAGIALLWLIGSQAFKTRLEWWLTGLAATGAVALAIIFYNFLRAPDRIHREQAAASKVLEDRIEKRRATQEYIAEMRAIWTEGEALWKQYPKMDHGMFQRDALEWFEKTKKRLAEIAAPNEAWMFETKANFAPGNNPALALQDRVEKLRRIVDRMIRAREAI